MIFTQAYAARRQERYNYTWHHSVDVKLLRATTTHFRIRSFSAFLGRLVEVKIVITSYHRYFINLKHIKGVGCDYPHFFVLLPVDKT